MLDLLLVDDDELIRDGLAGSFDWGALGFRLVGQARSGAQALALVAKLRPAAMILDIRMPGMSGIDVLQALRKDHPDVAVMLLSAHSEFEYAREGLKLGAFDYVLKIDVLTELEPALRRLAAEVVRRKERTDEASRLQAVRQGERLVALLEGRSEGWEPLPYMAVALWALGDREAVYGALERRLAILGAPSCRRGELLVFLLAGADVSRAEQAVRRLRGAVVDVNGADLAAGASAPSSEAADGPGALAQAARVVDLTRAGQTAPLLYPEQAAGGHAPPDPELTERAVELLDPQGVAEALATYFERCLADPRVLIPGARLFCYDILARLRRIAEESGFDVLASIEAAARPLANIYSLVTLRDRFVQSMASLMERVELQRSERHFGSIEAAQQLIRRNYARWFRLEELARYAAMSSSNFRLKFAQIVGMPVGAFVRSVRVREACRLLATTDLKVHEVAAHVGYEDAKHFRRVFQQDAGCSPGQYRADHRSPPTF